MSKFLYVESKRVKKTGDTLSQQRQQLSKLFEIFMLCAQVDKPCFKLPLAGDRRLLVSLLFEIATAT